MAHVAKLLKMEACLYFIDHLDLGQISTLIIYVYICSVILNIGHYEKPANHVWLNH